MKLRPYQQEASNIAVKAMREHRNGLIVIPTGGGKSLVIADIAYRLEEPLLVFCPNKEILEQNVGKMGFYGVSDIAVYSASLNSKMISKITFATIGSVMNHKVQFDRFKYVIVDEAHLVNAKGGQYKEFIESKNRTVLGLTATPYRLDRGFNGGSILKFLTRTRPRVFDELLYYVQISDLLNDGYLADLKYYDLTDITNFDISRVRTNSTGADYDDESLKQEYTRIGYYDKLTTTVLRVMNPKSGKPRRGILVFTKFIEEADMLVRKLKANGVSAAIVTGETPLRERQEIIRGFRGGEIDVVSNVGTLTTGFDYPELDTVIIGRPTRSLGLWYQMIGRIIRPHNGKDAWVVDLCGTYRRFGAVSDLKIDVERPYTKLYCIKSKGIQLTNIEY